MPILKDNIRRYVIGVAAKLGEAEVRGEEVEAMIADLEMALKLLNDAAETAYEDDGGFKKGWRL